VARAEEHLTNTVRQVLIAPPKRRGFYMGTSLIRNRTPPLDHHRALGIGLLQVPRERRFLMSEVSLQYVVRQILITPPTGRELNNLWLGRRWCWSRWGSTSRSMRTGLNPKPYTLNLTPYTLNPKPSILQPQPYTLNHKP